MNCPYCHQIKIKTKWRSEDGLYQWYECHDCKIRYRADIDHQEYIGFIIMVLPIGEVRLEFRNQQVSFAWIDMLQEKQRILPLPLAEKLTPKNAEHKIRTFLTFS